MDRMCQKMLEQSRQATRQTVPSLVRPFHVSLVSPFAGFQYKPPFSLLSPIGIRTSALWSSAGTVNIIITNSTIFARGDSRVSAPEE